MIVPRLCMLLTLAFLVELPALSSAAQPAPVRPSEWVREEADGMLAYRSERGNTIPDFSRAGYRGGGVRLPEMPIRVTLTPLPGGDDGARIQAAIDDVARRPADAEGRRGAVLLRRGTYRIEGSLMIRAGGVVLRGEGSGTDGTVIVATGKKQRTLIDIGAARASRTELTGSRRQVVDTYVPWSSHHLRLDSVAGLSLGDRVIVHRPSTAAWITALGMDRIKPRPGSKPGETQQWKAGDYDLHFERTITAIEGTRLTLDAPVMNAIDAQFGGASVYRYTYSRIAECAVEGLRLVSDYEAGKETTDEEHAWTGINFGHVENAWARDIVILHFCHGLSASNNSMFVTIEDCRHLDPVSQITGGRRYSFSLNGQYGLVLRCHSRSARHTFVNGSRTRGPNVFLEGTAVQSHSDSGPHHRWAVGTLYDNIFDDNEIRVQDRQYAGSGHGWAGATQVLWNCRSERFVLQQPPTAQNYAIGCVGTFVPGSWAPDAPLGVIESTNSPVRPRSLYLAQLKSRLGPGALPAVGEK